MINLNKLIIILICETDTDTRLMIHTDTDTAHTDTDTDTGIGIGMGPIPIPGIFTCYVPGIGTIPRLDLISVSSFLVFRKMSFTIHLNFSPLAGIII